MLQSDILIWVACASTRVMMTSRPVLLPRATYASVVLIQLRSVLMFMACVISTVAMLVQI